LELGLVFCTSLQVCTEARQSWLCSTYT